MPDKIPRAVVGAIIFNKSNEVLLIRSSGKFGSQWIVPGGKIDWGESIEPALRREIKEETNLDITDISFKGVRELIEPSRHFIFLEHTCRTVNENDVVLNSESTEFGWFNKQGLGKLDIARPTVELLNRCGVLS